MSERVMWMSVALVILATVTSIQLINVAAGSRGASVDVAAADHGAEPADLPAIKIALPF